MKNDHAFNVNDWGGYAECYDALNELKPYQDLQKAVINQLALTRAGLTLDVACGTGNMQFWLKKSKKFFNTTIFGLDFSDEMLGVAKIKNQEKHFRYFKHNLNKPLPFGDEYFDQAVSVNTLYALEDPSRALSEFFRVLKKGGRLVLVNPKKGYENGLILKEHCGDSGPDKPWLGIHLNESKERELLEKAVSNAEARARMLAIAKYNRQISFDRKFHFMSLPELARLFSFEKFNVIHDQSLYADQAIMMVAQK